MNNSFQFTAPETPGLVSVVIPAYRSDEYLPATLRSIGRQTYAHWEVLVVEDDPCGTCGPIVEEFAKQHPEHRVEYRRNAKNGGPSLGRNVAIEMSRGQYIATLDSDDRWQPEHLEHAVAALEQTSSDIVYSCVLMVEDGSDRLLGLWGPTPEEIGNFPTSLFGRNFVTPSATVLRRSVFADVGTWDLRYSICEDLDYWLRCVRLGKKFHFITGLYCLYRKCHSVAQTRKLCACIEGTAVVAARYLDIPGLPPRSCRRKVSNLFGMAARAHHRNSPEDRSAEPRRAAALMVRAWKVRPRRVGHLLQALYFALRHNLFSTSPNSAQSVARLTEKASSLAQEPSVNQRKSAA